MNKRGWWYVDCQLLKKKLLYAIEIERAYNLKESVLICGKIQKQSLIILILTIL